MLNAWKYMYTYMYVYTCTCTWRVHKHFANDVTQAPVELRDDRADDGMAVFFFRKCREFDTAEQNAVRVDAALLVEIRPKPRGECVQNSLNQQDEWNLKVNKELLEI